MFNISNTKPAQTFVFAAQISTNVVAQTDGIVLVIISFYGVPTSRRLFERLTAIQRGWSVRQDPYRSSPGALGRWALLLDSAGPIYIYIYAFSRRFYPKRLTLHSSYSFTFYQLLLSLGIEPMILALLAPCSTI